MRSKFDEIRSFDNTDLPSMLGPLAAQQGFIDTLVAFKFSKWPSFTKPILTKLTAWFVANKITKLANIKDFQSLVEPYVRRMINTTTEKLTVTGLDTLDLSKPCLFVSNHRDIVLDPAFVNWVLHINGQDTVRIAVGDNLLRKDWVATLIRLNKCFVVKRSVENRREKLNAAKLLSEYIYYSLKTEKQHLWIAQREGRAKDGIDITNNAILSMLTLNKPKEESFGDYIRRLRIVPVSISYEYDPCDILKAKELHKIEKDGSYVKAENEDIVSIVKGINGQKGKVHIHFGKLVSDEFSDAKSLAKYIDSEILAGYKVFGTSHAASIMLDTLYAAEVNNTSISDPDLVPAFQYLQNRLETLNQKEQEKLLQMYANPLFRQQATI